MEVTVVTPDDGEGPGKTKTFVAPGRGHFHPSPEAFEKAPVAEPVKPSEEVSAIDALTKLSKAIGVVRRTSGFWFRLQYGNDCRKNALDILQDVMREIIPHMDPPNEESVQDWTFQRLLDAYDVGLKILANEK